MCLMSETSETPTVRTATATAPPPPPRAEAVTGPPGSFNSRPGSRSSPGSSSSSRSSSSPATPSGSIGSRRPPRSPHAPRDDAPAPTRWSWWCRRSLGRTRAIRRVRLRRDSERAWTWSDPVVGLAVAHGHAVGAARDRRAHGVIGGPRRANNPRLVARRSLSAGLRVIRGPNCSPGFTASLLPERVTAVIGMGNIQNMSQTPEPSTEPTTVAAAPPPPPPPRAKPPRLYAAAAWVVIVAGIIFILSVIFFSGAIILGHNHCHHFHHGMFRPGVPGGPWGPPPGYGPWQPDYPADPACLLRLSVDLVVRVARSPVRLVRVAPASCRRPPLRLPAHRRAPSRA